MSEQSWHRAVVGWPVELYKRQMILRADAADGLDRAQPITLSGDLDVYDLNRDRFRMLCPSAGDYEMAVSCGGFSTSFGIRAVAAPVAGTKRVVCLGDSVTASVGGFVQIVKQSILGARVTMCGTRGSGDYKHEGVSGWGYETHATDPTSAITTGGVLSGASITAYNATIGGAPDLWILNCGINGPLTADPEDLADVTDVELDYLDAITAAIRAAQPSVPIVVGCSWPGSASQAFFASDYPANPDPERTDWMRKRHFFQAENLGRNANREDEDRFVMRTDLTVNEEDGYLNAIHPNVSVGLVETAWCVAAHIAALAGY